MIVSKSLNPQANMHYANRSYEPERRDLERKLFRETVGLKKVTLGKKPRERLYKVFREPAAELETEEARMVSHCKT